VTAQFTTAGLGVIPCTGGDVDDMVRREAWLKAHKGGRIGREASDQLVYTARWPDGTVAATAYADLGLLMNKLDRIEDNGGCPVHRGPS
jgi:hypothetical protein